MVDDKKKKHKLKKALGQDPFSDFDDFSELDNNDEQAQSSLPDEDIADVEISGVVVEEKVEEETEFEQPVEAETVPKQPVEAETVPEQPAEAETVSEQLAKAETEETEELAPGLLDELIATIEEEIEQTFEGETVADLYSSAFTRTGDEEQHVIFSLAGTEYAVPIANITEIGRPLTITPIPNLPEWTLGVANLRGDIISMVDLRMFLGMEGVVYNQDSRMLVTKAQYEEMTTGLIVDRVNEIRHLSLSQINDPAAPIEDRIAPYLRGVYEQDGNLLVVIDFDKLLLSPEMQQFS